MEVDRIGYDAIDLYCFWLLLWSSFPDSRSLFKKNIFRRSLSRRIHNRDKFRRCRCVRRFLARQLLVSCGFSPRAAGETSTRRVIAIGSVATNSLIPASSKSSVRRKQDGALLTNSSKSGDSPVKKPACLSISRSRASGKAISPSTTTTTVSSIVLIPQLSVWLYWQTKPQTGDRGALSLWDCSVSFRFPTAKLPDYGQQ